MSSSAAASTQSAPPGALIFLHGLGDTPAGWEDTIQEELPRIHPRLSHLIYRFPHAPTIPISINGGAKMTGWFDLYDWPIDTSAQEDRTMVQQSAALLNQEIQSVRQEFQLSARQIVVGGFSQGGAIALVTAYHDEYGWRNEAEDDRLGACVNLSGWWPLKRTPDASSRAPQKDVPLFWGHGRYDDKVLFEHQAVEVKYLQEQLGVKQILAQQYPMGHSSDPNELRDVADFVDRVLFGGGEQQQQDSKTTATAMDKEL